MYLHVGNNHKHCKVTFKENEPCPPAAMFLNGLKQSWSRVESHNEQNKYFVLNYFQIGHCKVTFK